MAPKTRANTARALEGGPPQPHPPSPVLRPADWDDDVGEQAHEHAQLAVSRSQHRHVDGYPDPPIIPPETSWPHYYTSTKCLATAATAKIDRDLVGKHLASVVPFLAELCPTFGDRHAWASRVDMLGYEALHDIHLLRLFHPDLIKKVLKTVTKYDYSDDPVAALIDASLYYNVRPHLAHQLIYFYLHDQAKAFKADDRESLKWFQHADNQKMLLRALMVFAWEMQFWRGGRWILQKKNEARNTNGTAGREENGDLQQQLEVERADSNLEGEEPPPVPARAQQGEGISTLPDYIKLAER